MTARVHGIAEPSGRSWRELKETSFRLRVLRKAGILTAAHDPVIGECAELVKIVAAVLRRLPRN